jgi:hypothetical protein
MCICRFPCSKYIIDPLDNKNGEPGLHYECRKKQQWHSFLTADKASLLKTHPVTVAGKNNYMKVAGIILIVVGILMFIFRGFSFTKEKEVVDLGPLEINKKENHSIGWPVYAGAVAVIAGIVMVVSDKKRA